MPRGPNSDVPAAGGRPSDGLRQGLSRFFLKPPDPNAPPRPVLKDRSVEELEHDNRYADDRERLVGLLGAPVAAAIAILVVSALLAHDPAALLKSGLPNSKHVNPSLYEELLGVLLLLSLAMLVMAWFRRRLFLGAAMALYGLAIFNLHYWGFGVPFVLFGAWLLVRAYRVQRDLREATGTLPSRYGRQDRAKPSGGAPPPSKRYTPPSAPRRGKPSPLKGPDEQKAG